MTPLLIGNLASAALGAIDSATSSSGSSQSDPFGSLLAQLEQTGTEKTVTNPDGSTVTTLSTPSGERVVSETSASGQTLTQAGAVSPAAAHKFLDSLFSTLQSEGATVVNGTASSVVTAANKLDQQLTMGSGKTQGLVNAFGGLLQNAGMPLPSGTTASTALKSFLDNAVPAIESGKLTTGGLTLRS